MRDHLVPTRAGGGLVAVALVLLAGAGTLGSGPASALAPVHAPVQPPLHLVVDETDPLTHPPRVTPDAAERRYASCIAGAPATPRVFEAWSTRCRERVAAGRM